MFKHLFNSTNKPVKIAVCTFFISTFFIVNAQAVYAKANLSQKKIKAKTSSSKLNKKTVVQATAAAIESEASFIPRATKDLAQTIQGLQENPIDQTKPSNDNGNQASTALEPANTSADLETQAPIVTNSTEQPPAPTPNETAPVNPAPRPITAPPVTSVVKHRAVTPVVSLSKNNSSKELAFNFSLPKNPLPAITNAISGISSPLLSYWQKPISYSSPYVSDALSSGLTKILNISGLIMLIAGIWLVNKKTESMAGVLAEFGSSETMRLDLEA